MDNVDAEISVIGTCLVYPDAVSQVYPMLKPEMFFSQAHQRIFSAIVSLLKKNAPCDLLSVTNKLREGNNLDAVGGAAQLTRITENIYTDSLIVNHATIVYEKFLLREYSRFAGELLMKASGEGIENVIEFAQTEIFKLSNHNEARDPKPLSASIDDLLLKIQKIQAHEIDLSGIPSGIASIDDATGGWQPQNLIIIAGRVSHGKTAMALQLAKNSAAKGFPVAIFSLEMSSTELATRFLSGVSGYSNMTIASARVNLDKLSYDSNDVALLPMYIDDTSPLSVFELRSKIKKLVVRHGVRLVIVDYLQLMKGEGKNREQEISSISRGLKSMAKELNIPVIALAQLNREVENRTDRRPRLSDLRESGAIEQDADIVAFISRPITHGEKTVEIDGEEINTNGLMLFDIAKNRNGACFTLGLKHNEHLSEIYE